MLSIYGRRLPYTGQNPTVSLHSPGLYTMLISRYFPPLHVYRAREADVTIISTSNVTSPVTPRSPSPPPACSSNLRSRQRLRPGMKKVMDQLQRAQDEHHLYKLNENSGDISLDVLCDDDIFSEKSTLSLKVRINSKITKICLDKVRLISSQIFCIFSIEKC